MISIREPDHICILNCFNAVFCCACFLEFIGNPFLAETVLYGHEIYHSIPFCAHIMDVGVPENVNVISLGKFLSSRSILMFCIGQCQVLYSHDPSDGLYVYMNARIPKKYPYYPVTVGCSIC